MQSVVIEQFPGLDLRQDPGDSRGALVASNVVLEGGTVRSRDGFARMVNGVAGNNVMFLHPHTDDGFASNAQFIEATNAAAGTVFARDSTGASLATTTLLGVVTSRRATAVTIGTTTSTSTYITDTAGTGPVRKWNGTVWSSPAGFPATIGTLSYMPTDNRLVVCDVSTSKVSFSDQGAPETYGANNFVYLTPGDGETIVGAAVFNNQTFIFKNTKFFVFYGNSDNPAAPGTPVFNYRSVDTGAGAYISSNYPTNAMVAGPDGVYFQGRDGIYKTTGGPPVRISQPLDPFYVNTQLPASEQSPFSPYGTWNTTLHMAFHAGKLYIFGGFFVASTAHNGFMVIVYDPVFNTWVFWPDFPVNGTNGLMSWNGLLVVGHGKDILAQSLGTTTDDVAGVATSFISTYRLPFESYGSSNRKRIRETIVEGYGALTVAWSHDWGALDSNALPITLGTAPALAVARTRRSMRGRYFSVNFTTSSGRWQVNRLQANIADITASVGITAA